jgi:hypothetical protein
MDRDKNQKTMAKRERDKNEKHNVCDVMWPRDGIQCLEQQQFKAEGWARNRVAKEGGQASVLEKGYRVKEERE